MIMVSIAIGYWNISHFTYVLVHLYHAHIGTIVANSSANVNAGIIISLMDFTNVLMLKIFPILAITNTDINISVSLLMIAVGSTCTSQEYN